MRMRVAIQKMTELIQVPRNYVFCWLKGLKPDGTWRFYGLPVVKVGGHGQRMIIGKRLVAVSNYAHNAFGIIQKVVIKTVGAGAMIKMGDDVGLSGCTISAEKSIYIGSHVLVGSGAIIADHDAHPIDPDSRRLGGGGAASPIIIEDDVFIGARAIILKGVTLGKGCVVGAGAVVTKNVPAYSIVAGNPSRIVGWAKKNA